MGRRRGDLREKGRGQDFTGSCMEEKFCLCFHVSSFKSFLCSLGLCFLSTLKKVVCFMQS